MHKNAVSGETQASVLVSYYIRTLIPDALKFSKAAAVLRTSHVAAVVMNVEEDIAVYTARAIGDVRAINKQLHVRPPLNSLSQHDMAHIWEDKVFRQLCIGSRLDRSFVPIAELEQRIACALSTPPSMNNISLEDTPGLIRY